MRSADLFAGLGGSSTGIAMAGGSVAWVANHNADAIKWHSRNHPTATHYCQDLAELDWTRVERVSYLHASPVCHGSSECGQPAERGTGGNGRVSAERIARKHQADRNTAYAILAAADTLRPETITVENVPGFYQWEAFEAWCAMLRAFGYVVTPHILNARDFGGAQDRPRAIITARLGKALHLEVPNIAPRTIGDCLEADVADKWWSPIDSKSARMRWGIHKAQHEAGSQCFWNNVSEARGRAWDDVFPTATTKSGSQWCVIDGERVRIITPREEARSMSFPDSYAIPSVRKVSSPLIGNAMDVKLSESIAAQVMAA